MYQYNTQYQLITHPLDISIHDLLLSTIELITTPGNNCARLPNDSLLNRYADIIDGVYTQKVKGLPVFHMIGQRLFTGRVAVAQVV